MSIQNPLPATKTGSSTTLKYICRNYGLYLCLIPGILYYLTFCYAPMAGIVVAFKDYNIFKGIAASPWAGLKYFRALFNLPNFSNMVSNTLTLNLLNLVFGFPAPIILALLLNELKSVRFRRVCQSLLYIPHFMSWIVLASIITNLLSPQYGMVNQLIRLLGGTEIFFMADETWWIIIYVISSIWSGIGWGTIVYMAALTGISQELYEAARVDGANRFKQMLHVTLPGIAPTIVIMLILKMGSLVSMGFEQPMALYNPLVSRVAEVISTFSYIMGVERAQYSLTTALGFLQALINMLLIVSANTITKRLGSDGLY